MKNISFLFQNTPKGWTFNQEKSILTIASNQEPNLTCDDIPPPPSEVPPAPILEEEDQNPDAISSEPTEEKTPTRKSTISCKECKKRNLKCDQETPCENCELNGWDCIYDTIPKKLKEQKRLTPRKTRKKHKFMKNKSKEEETPKKKRKIEFTNSEKKDKEKSPKVQKTKKTSIKTPTQKGQEVIEWLKSIRMEQYVKNFLDQGFDDLEIIAEDGLSKLFHFILICKKR